MCTLDRMGALAEKLPDVSKSPLSGEGKGNKDHLVSTGTQKLRCMSNMSSHCRAQDPEALRINERTLLHCESMREHCHSTSA